jgi:pimeloyl-ACP methyl ester carboxylesterase
MNLNEMPFIELPNSPHAPGIRPVEIHYRDVGNGRPLVFLHGGWGYGVYPITRQIKAFEGQVRFVIPDRSGYGRSTQLPGQMPPDFHQRAAEETLLVLDALGISRAIFWGHSDGAVIAAKIGLLAPERCERLLLEAFHFEPAKPNSRSFFRQFATHPEDVKEKMQRLLIADHGKDEDHNRWKKVVQRNCRVWLKLAAQSKGPDDDLFAGRLDKLKVPVTFIHGRSDPRTEPEEMERVQEALPRAKMCFVETGRHSPHSERKSWQECNEILSEFLEKK